MSSQFGWLWAVKAHNVAWSVWAGFFCCNESFPNRQLVLVACLKKIDLKFITLLLCFALTLSTYFLKYRVHLYMLVKALGRQVNTENCWWITKFGMPLWSRLDLESGFGWCRLDLGWNWVWLYDGFIGFQIDHINWIWFKWELWWKDSS